MTASSSAGTARWIVLILLAGLVLRVAWPLADPADRFSWSNGIYTDPPTMVHPARNAALRGEWITDYNRDLWIYPLMNGLTRLAYLPAGPGRLPTVLLSALLGTAMAGALAWSLYRSAGPRAALVGAILAAFNQWLVFFARVPVAENLVALMLALASGAALGRSTRSQALAGALAVAATLFGKYHALGFLPGLLLFAWLRGGGFRTTLPLLGGGAAVFVAWFFAIFLPHSGDVLGHVERQSTGLHGQLPFLVSVQDGLKEILNTLRRSWMFFRMPVVGSLGGLFALWVAGNRAARRRALENGTALYAFWFVGTWLYFSLLPYKAPRYYLILAPAMVAGAAVVIDRMLHGPEIKLRAPASWDEHVPLVVCLYTFLFGAIDAVKHYVSILLEYLTLPPPRISREAFDGIVGIFRHVDTFHQGLTTAAILTIVAYVIALWNPEIAARLGRPQLALSRGALRSSGRILVAGSVVFGLWQWGWWAAHRTTFLEDVKASLPALVGEDAVLMGPLAPLLAQDGGHRALPYFGPPGRDDLLAEYGVTHVVLSGTGDADDLEKRYPGLLVETAIVQVWPIRTLFASTLEVRRVPREFGGRRIHDYEPTLFELGAGEALAERWQEALDRFQAHREAGGRETPELLSLESVCWFKLGDYDRAKALLERIVVQRPLDPLNWQSLGVLALRDGDRAGALEFLMRAWRLDPNNEELEKAVRELVR